MKEMDIRTKKADICLLIGNELYFTRTDVEKVTGLKHTRASELNAGLKRKSVIESVKGHGKGRYGFVKL